MNARIFDTRDNLDVLPDEFVGRTQDIAYVLKALFETKAWIISIDGIGGVGKSRLALEVAYQVKDMKHYAGIVWVSAKGSWLTPSGIENKDPRLNSLDDLLEQIIRVSGLGEDPIETFDERKARVLKIISNSPYLLIVDNLETVRDDDRRSIEEFLSSLSARETGDTKAIITSREPTNCPGASIIKLDGLEEEEGIQLILQDAASYQEDSLLNAEKEVLREIWQQCAGLPLAIKWTVAMVAGEKYSLFETLSELRKSTGDVLLYIFGSVFERLSEDAKTILYSTSAFVASVPESAIGELALLSNTRVKSGISELLSLYLIHLAPRRLLRSTYGERFILHSATRLCIQAVCEDNPGLCDVFLTRASDYYKRLWTGITSNSELKQFEDDYQNSIFILDWCFDKQKWADVVQLATRLDLYMNLRGLSDDRIEVCNLGLLAARYLSNGKQVIEFKEAKGKAYKQKGMYLESEQQFRECSEFYRNIGLDKELARVRMQLGILVEHQVEYSTTPTTKVHRDDRLKEALEEYTEAYKTFKSLGDRPREAQTLHLISRALRHLKRFDESETKLMESLRIKHDLGNAVRIAISEHELARLRHLQGRKDEAEYLYRKSIVTLTELGAEKDLANANWRYSLLLREDHNRLTEAYQRNLDAVNAYKKQSRRPKYKLSLNDLQRLEKDLEEKENEVSERKIIKSDELHDGMTIAIGESAVIRNRIFISYSHEDSEWLTRLRVHMKPLEREGYIDIFDDTMIQIGSLWLQEIENAIASAKIAILLISADFLASDFIQDNELPPLLKAAEADGAIIIPIIISPCNFKQIEKSCSISSSK